MSNPITSFVGEYRWLSNFWPTPVEMDGETYPSVEHAYQAAKSEDPEYRRLVREQKSPGAAKRAGRRGRRLRADWDSAKLSVMHELVSKKFEDQVLRGKLLATGDAELVEGNDWGDRFWGVCRGKGNNHLGRILMSVREAAKNAR